MVGPETPQHLLLDRLVDGRDFGTHGLRDLYPVCTNASAGAVDQHGFAWLDLCQPHEVKCVQTAQRHGRGVGERHVGGLGNDAVARGESHVLGVGAEPQLRAAEDLIARREVCDASTDAVDDAGEVAPQDAPFWASHTEHDPERQPEPLDRVLEAPHLDVGLRRFGGANADQDLAVSRRRLLDLFDVQNLRRSVPVVRDRFHLLPTGTCEFSGWIAAGARGRPRTAMKRPEYLGDPSAREGTR